MDENTHPDHRPATQPAPITSPIVIAKCAHCRGDVITFVDLNRGTEIWHHLREVGNRKIIGSRSCKWTFAEPEDES